jgi:hypothetical protein
MPRLEGLTGVTSLGCTVRRRPPDLVFDSKALLFIREVLRQIDAPNEGRFVVMPGNPSATIEPWTIPAQPLQFFDHTYVTSSCGYKWGCFGRDSGGTVVVSGRTGDSNVAECLSHPRRGQWRHAGLDYLVHGVCHQATNRVLEPTGCTLIGSNKRARVRDTEFPCFVLEFLA